MLVDEPHRFRRVERAREGEGAPRGEGAGGLAEAEHPAERQCPEYAAPGVGRVTELAGHREGVGGDARVAVHHELGGARRAGGGEHVGAVAGGGPVLVEGRALEKVRERDPAAAGERAGEGGRGRGRSRAPGGCPVPLRFLVDEQGLQAVKGAPVDLREDVEERDAAKARPEGERLRPGAPHDVRHLDRAEAGVDRDGDRAEARRPEPEDEVRGGVGQPEGHPVAVPDAELREPARGAARGPVELREGDAPPPVRDGRRPRRPPPDLGKHLADGLHGRVQAGRRTLFRLRQLDAESVDFHCFLRLE